MSTLLNIIHPYIFKLLDKTFVVGQIPEFKERDIKISKLIKIALKSKYPVLLHRTEPSDSISGSMKDISFYFDKELNVLLDKKIDYVLTTLYGLPIPNRKPENISNEIWRKMIQNSDNETSFKNKIGKPNICINIGGLLENCMTNTMGYIRNKVLDKKSKIYYVPEVCVSLNKKNLKESVSKLNEIDIFPISYNDSISLFSS